MSKLYTEEQVRQAYNEGVNNGYSYITVEEDKCINSLTPIELPSDEEIEDSRPYNSGGGSYNSIANFHRYEGAMWLKYKILNQNK